MAAKAADVDQEMEENDNPKESNMKNVAKAVIGMVMMSGVCFAGDVEVLQKEYAELATQRQQVEAQLEQIKLRQTEIIGAAKYIESKKTPPEVDNEKVT